MTEIPLSMDNNKGNHKEKKLKKHKIREAKQEQQRHKKPKKIREVVNLQLRDQLNKIESYREVNSNNIINNEATREAENEKKILMITKKTGLSRFMIRVCLDIWHKSIKLETLTHLVNTNSNIISLNKNYLQNYIEEYKLKQNKKGFSSKNETKQNNIISSSSSSNLDKNGIRSIRNETQKNYMIKDEELRKYIIETEGEKYLIKLREGKEEVEED